MLVLIRHGLTDHNARGILQGQMDTELSALGTSQAQRLAERLRNWPIKTIISSDLKRAQQTARTIAHYHETEVTLTSELREVHLGDWQGLTLEEVREKYSIDYGVWLANRFSSRRPGGESNQDLLLRMRNEVNKLNLENNERMIVMVSHGLAIRTLVADLLDLDHTYINRITVDNASITIMKKATDKWCLHALNDTAHLEDY